MSAPAPVGLWPQSAASQCAPTRAVQRRMQRAGHGRDRVMSHGGASEPQRPWCRCDDGCRGAPRGRAAWRAGIGRGGVTFVRGRGTGGNAAERERHREAREAREHRYRSFVGALQTTRNGVGGDGVARGGGLRFTCAPLVRGAAAVTAWPDGFQAQPTHTQQALCLGVRYVRRRYWL